MLIFINRGISITQYPPTNNLPRLTSKWIGLSPYFLSIIVDSIKHPNKKNSSGLPTAFYN
jgi:hypothetical protein